MMAEKNQTKKQSQLPGGRSRSIKAKVTPGGRRLSSDRTWALVLMGGGARGLAHLGVLRALLDNDLVPPVITGTSMGAVVGGLFSAGYLPGEIETIAQDLSSESISQAEEEYFPIPDQLLIILFLKPIRKNWSSALAVRKVIW
jgi:predicted acylesterase/phospholipase RssA